MLELCNFFNISLCELFTFKDTTLSPSFIYNPFNSNKLYLYYYTDKKLITSIIDIYPENNIYKCKFFNGIKNIQYYKKCSYYYEGFLESNKTTAYFTLNNASLRNDMLEKVEIVVNINWSNEINICKGLILGLTPNSLPIVKKVILSTSEISNIDKYNNALTFSKEEVKKIFYDGALILENKNYDEFFFDF